MKTVSVIVNKNWEAEPFLNAVVNSELNSGLPFPDSLNSPQIKNYRSNKSRADFNLFVEDFKRDENGCFSKDDNGERIKIKTQTLKVSVWCIQDLMFPNVPSGQSLDPKTQSSSSSEEKYNVLPSLITAENATFFEA